jgi:hypothetical protein
MVSSARRAQGFPCGDAETVPAMRGVPLGAVYVIVGVVVAAINDYFDDLATLRAVGEAILAVIIWPLILLGVDVNLR